MLYILRSFNKKYLNSAYLIAKSCAQEETLLYEFLNSAPNELKSALNKRKLTKTITQNDVEWCYIIDLKTKALTFSANDKANNVTYRATFFKMEKENIKNIKEYGIHLGEFEISISKYNHEPKFLKPTREYIAVKPFLYEFTLYKSNNEFLVKTINKNQYSFETRFNSELYTISNENEQNY